MTRNGVTFVSKRFVSFNVDSVTNFNIEDSRR